MSVGIETLEELGDTSAEALAAVLKPDTAVCAQSFEVVREQARLQLQGRRERRYLYELLDDLEDRGLRLLPAPDAGDVWFDTEGHPFYETSCGLEYLFGYCFRDDDVDVVHEAVEGETAMASALPSSGSSTGSSPAVQPIRECTSTTTPRTSDRR